MPVKASLKKLQRLPFGKSDIVLPGASSTPALVALPPAAYNQPDIVRTLFL